jgi:AraC-like DNA-binding protein
LKSLEIQPYPILKVKVDSILWIACRMTGQFREALDYHEEFSKGKTAILGEKQHQQLNELTLTLKVREKDLTIANQQLELVKKQRYQITLILITIIIGLLVIGQFIYIMKTRKHRQMLFRKDKAADDQANEMREWMEWKLSKEKSTGASVTGEGDPSEREDQPGDENWSQRELYAELREIFEKQKIYLDPELNLNTVIKLLGTNRKYLYQAMSGSSDDNFRTFINRYRVDEAKHVINAQVLNGEEVNFPELYTYAGFNSPASFYRVFKSVTGLTPKEYASEIVRMQHTTQP